MKEASRNLLLVTLLVACAESRAATFTVTNTADTGVGSFRQAIEDANSNLGPDEVQFAIQGVGSHVIMTTSPLPEISDPVLIDGYSQAGATKNSLADGFDADLMIILQSTLTIASGGSGSTVRGLNIQADTGNAIALVASQDNKIEGNLLAGSVNGVSSEASSSNVVGGPTVAERNHINSNQTGIFFFGVSTQNTVQGNLIESNSEAGVDIECSKENRVMNNEITRNGGPGVAIRNPGAVDNQIADNYIGTKIFGEIQPNLGDGVVVFVRVEAGTALGINRIVGNTIAYNGGNGVHVAAQDSDIDTIFTKPVEFLQNSIFDNEKLGIDLGGYCTALGNCFETTRPTVGVTSNDQNDSDFGPNNLQNFPELASATNTLQRTTVTGALRSTPSAPFEIELFVSTECDSTGFGEGESFFGGVTVTSDATGLASFTFVAKPRLPVGHFITATARGREGTSEFSRCIPVTGMDCDGDGIPDGTDNCAGTPNPTQCDSDTDLIGNHCDPDFNNDGVVGIPDFNIFRACFGRLAGQPGFDPRCDLSCDGAVGLPDFNIFRSFFGRAPGSACP